ANLPVDDFWTSAPVCHGRAAALDAIGTMHATYYAVGGSRPGIACMAVDGTTQNGRPPTPQRDRHPDPRALRPARRRHTHRSRPRAVILAGFDCNPRPIPRATAHDLAALIGDKIATVPDRTPIAV
ncbi:hypothetical protein GS457_25295, partial [Rhodococcus hoagii]|nr:hypothetical protein [Prescottella equi]